MNISKILMLGTFASLCLASCTNEDFPTYDTHQGSMSLTVDQLQPSATRAVATDDYPVAIYSATDNKLYASYAKASLVPSKLLMPVGKFYSEAHTPGTLSKFMDTPYYSGRDEFEILQGINTVSTIVCRMANGSITVKFSDLFDEAFISWTVTINDGSSTSLIYTSDKDGTQPPTKYIKYEDNVSQLNVDFVGTTVKGNRITANHIVTKKQATEKYDGDTEFFSGGDAIVMIFDTSESTEGDISGITINANIKFEESEESFDMEVEDNVPEEDEGDDTPSGDDTGDITLKLPKNMVIDFTTDPSLGDAYIKCVNGIKSIKVKMSSDNPGMMGALSDLVAEYPTVTLIEGTDIVGNQGMVDLFNGLGQELSVPSEGDTEYTFPIGNFFILLSAVQPAVDTFEMEVTDMLGNTKKGKLILAVGCELPEGADEPEDDDDQTGGEPSSNITLNLPADMTITATTDPSLGDANIECASGIQSIVVKISSDNNDMMNSLATMANNYEGVTFIEGTDIVGNQELVRLFTELGQQLSVPAVGDNSYTFPIGNFFSLLVFMPGNHTFDMIVTDCDGNTKSDKLVLTVE